MSPASEQQPKAQQPEQPKAQQPDAQRPEAERPESLQPEGPRSEAQLPEASEADAQPVAQQRGSHRAPLSATLAALVTGGAAALWSSSVIWRVLDVDREPPLPPVSYSIAGSGAVPMLVALGFVLLAAVVGVLATRAAGRRVVAVVVLAVSVWTAVQLVGWLSTDGTELTALMRESGSLHSIGSAPSASALGLPLAALSLVCALLSSLLLLARAGGMPGMGRKYERPQATSSQASLSPASEPGTGAAGASSSHSGAPRSDDPATRDRDMWSSLDRGEDPTA